LFLFLLSKAEGMKLQRLVWRKMVEDATGSRGFIETGWCQIGAAVWSPLQLVQL
jgi:hypothetical protein